MYNYFNSDNSNKKTFKNVRIFGGFDNETKNFPMWWSKRSDKCFYIKKIIQKDFAEEIETSVEENVANLPDVNSGNDLHLMSEKIFTAIANKTSLQQIGVGSTTINYNEQTCDFRFSYQGHQNSLEGNRLEKNKKIRNYFASKFINKELEGNIRVHIILPGTNIPEKCKDDEDWKPGIKYKKEILKYTEEDEMEMESIIINIDGSNLLLTNSFSEKFCYNFKKDLEFITKNGNCSCNSNDNSKFICDNCNCSIYGKLCSASCGCSSDYCNQQRAIKKQKLN